MQSFLNPGLQGELAALQLSATDYIFLFYFLSRGRCHLRKNILGPKRTENCPAEIQHLQNYLAGGGKKKKTLNFSKLISKSLFSFPHLDAKNPL